jgi:APA family basic amino acid/polyamine antiporter
LFAWIIGWDLVLEYAVGAATVANGWSSYFQEVLGGFTIGGEKVTIPKVISGPVVVADEAGDLVLTGAWCNLPAILIVAVIAAILVKGIKESARFNAAMVFIKVAAVLFVILVGAFYVHSENWHPFAPYGWTGLNLFGYHVAGQVSASGEPVGMLAGAAIIFFAYIGFDAVSTQAEEARNPQRDVPIGIIASLLICTLLYVGVVAVLTGMVKFDQIDRNAGVSRAFQSAGLPWAELIIAAAGVAGITSVLLVMMLSAPRVALAMARDGLLPSGFFANVHPRFQTPWKSTILVGLFVGILAGFLPIDTLLHLTNIGTLFAFVVVCAAVLVMRVITPSAERPFRCPLVPIVPLLGIGACLLLMFSLPPINWLRLLIWLAIGLAIYFGYGRHHSRLSKELGQGRVP